MKSKDFNETVNGVASTASTECANDQQWTKYHSKQGHGFAAEDANAMWDKLHGKSVNKVGMDNAKNGADRIVNGVEIQTKYCMNATKSVDAAFENGQYRYPEMKLEVPKDQYEEAIRAYSGDSRSPIPMISVHSVGDLLYRRQN